MDTFARLLIGFYFLFFGFWNIYHWQPMLKHLIKKHLPLPWLFLSLVIGWQIILGFFIMMGFLTQLAALFLLPLVLMFVFVLHPFWDFSGELRKQHMAAFITMLTMVMGALLLLINNR